MSETRSQSMREIILDRTIELVAERGFENVSMREVAKAVGIKVSSIYNHYDSKDELLNCMYDFYESNFDANALSDEYMKSVIETGSSEEIIRVLNSNYLFQKDFFYTRLVLITKIIYMRCYNDDRANEIFQNKMGMSSAVISKMLQYGIDIGRLEPFDTKTFSNLMVGQYYYMGVKNFCMPNYAVGELAEEKEIEKMFIDFLPMKKNGVH